MSSGEGDRVQVRDVVADDVVEVIAETLGVEREELTFGSSAESIAEWTSLAHLRVVEAVEQRFGVLLRRTSAYRGRLAGRRRLCPHTRLNRIRPLEQSAHVTAQLVDARLGEHGLMSAGCP